MAITDNAQVLGMLVGGERVHAERTRTIHDPSTGEPIAEVADGTAADAERAVAAARAAYRRGDWSRITPGERAAVLDRLADLLEERAEELARTESRNTGKPLAFSSAFDLPLTVDNLRFFAGAARHLEGRASGEYIGGLHSSIVREPLGVCASITPWNYPLNMGAWKIGPALAAGNTATSSAPSAPPASWRPARCGSTSTWRSARRCRTAASSSPGSARTCPSTRSRSTRRSSTSRSS
jgi:betaine-aldehyde dehydrogenase